MAEIIPGVYSSVNDSSAINNNQALLRRYFMSLEKMIIGPDGSRMKVNSDGTLSVSIAGASSTGGAMPVSTSSSTLSSTITLQNSAAAIGVGSPLTTAGYGVALLAISGTFSATITFEGQGPDGNWYGISALQRSLGNIITTTNVTGIYELNVKGLSAIRANITSFTSGSITVKGVAQALAPSDHYLNANATISASNAIVPMDLQSHLQSTIQTHNAVSVAGSSSSLASSFIDCDGFDKVGITLMNDATASSYISLYWSNDGVSTHGLEDSLVTGTQSKKALISDIKARYLKVQLVNADTVSHTMSAWAYLKA